MTIDFSELALSPNESRAARSFLGLSQAQAAAKSNLPAHKLKRFEMGDYLRDTEFIQSLRDFFEGEGYNFNDEKTPGAKARAKGDVFQAGVIGDPASSTGETGGSPSVEPGKLQRPQTANLQFMRITQTLENEQIDRIFDCIEENEAAILEGLERPITVGFLESGPSAQSQAQAIAMLRRLAENGLLYARLMGRNLIPASTKGPVIEKSRVGLGLFTTSPPATTWKTVGELLQSSMTDAQLAILEGDKQAQARRKGRSEPTEVFQALVG